MHCAAVNDSLARILVSHSVDSICFAVLLNLILVANYGSDLQQLIGLESDQTDHGPLTSQRSMNRPTADTV
jgi:hypothetical protein